MPRALCRYAPRALRHLALQYTTLSQSRAHFLRHTNPFPHTGHTLVGRWFGLRTRVVLMLRSHGFAYSGSLIADRCADVCDAWAVDTQSCGSSSNVCLLTLSVK